MTSLPCVLLVEDNPDDEALMREAFRRARIGYRLEVARDGIEALARALDAPANERPVLMLLDLKLPRLSGLDVLARLRNQTSTVLMPIVVLSSSCERMDIAKSYEFGANSYLVKPLAFAELETLVRTIATYWLRHNEQPIWLSAAAGPDHASPRSPWPVPGTAARAKASQVRSRASPGSRRRTG
jgi:two-component system, response regulator